MKYSVCDVLTVFKFVVGIAIGLAGILQHSWIGLIAIWPIYEGIIAWNTKKACTVPIRSRNGRRFQSKR